VEFLLVIAGLVSVHVDNLLHLDEASLDVPNGVVVEGSELEALSIRGFLRAVNSPSFQHLLLVVHVRDLLGELVSLHVDLSGIAEVDGPVDEELVLRDVSFAFNGQAIEKGCFRFHDGHGGAHNIEAARVGHSPGHLGLQLGEVGHEKLDVDVLGASLVAEKGNKVLEDDCKCFGTVVFEQFVKIFKGSCSELHLNFAHLLNILVGVVASLLLSEVVFLSDDGTGEAIDFLGDRLLGLDGSLHLVEVLLLLLLKTFNLGAHFIEGLLSGSPVSSLVDSGIVLGLLSLVGLVEQDIEKLLVTLGVKNIYTVGDINC